MGTWRCAITTAGSTATAPAVGELGGTLYNTFAAWKVTGFDSHGIAGNPTFASSITPGAGPNQFKLGAGSPCLATGQGGVNMGAWDGTVIQIGCNF